MEGVGVVDRQNADIANTLPAPKGRCYGNHFLALDWL